MRIILKISLLAIYLLFANNLALLFLLAVILDIPYASSFICWKQRHNYVFFQIDIPMKSPKS